MFGRAGPGDSARPDGTRERAPRSRHALRRGWARTRDAHRADLRLRLRSVAVLITAIAATACSSTSAETPNPPSPTGSAPPTTATAVDSALNNVIAALR